MNPKVENLKGKLIVSCQALPDEPLHSSFIMGRMALAAKQGGASGIRANTPEDIKEIKTQVDLPVIGIIKRNYDDCEIYITPTIKEIDELMEAKPEIIALDATISSRPKGQKLDEFFHEIKEKDVYKRQGKNHPYSSAYGRNDQQTDPCIQTASSGTWKRTFSRRNRRGDGYSSGKSS